jgi:transglutaminase superfamily protein
MHERRLLRPLTTPARIQRFLDDEIAYNQEPHGATCYSPRTVLRRRAAHCMEGAVLAALALRRLGHPALLLDFEAVRDSDHVLAVYRVNGRWGAVAKSDYAGLRSREPVYATIRELAMSYFEHYYNPAGEKTLRAFSRPVNLARFDRSLRWMTTLDEIWPIPSYLCEIPHTQILAKPMERTLARTDTRLYEAGRVGGVSPPLFSWTRAASIQKASRRRPR